MGHTKPLSQPAAWHAPFAEPVLEDSSCSFRSVSCRTSRMGSTRSCSCSRIWRTSTPMSESRPRSASELSRLIPARSRMPAKGDFFFIWVGGKARTTWTWEPGTGRECWPRTDLFLSINKHHYGLSSPGHVTLMGKLRLGELGGFLSWLT